MQRVSVEEKEIVFGSEVKRNAFLNCFCKAVEYMQYMMIANEIDMETCLR